MEKQNMKNKNGLYYIEQKSGITITGFSDDRINIDIPFEIDGKKVIAIGNRDSNGCAIPLDNNFNSERNVNIEEGIKIIDDYAFAGQNIVNIKFPNSLQYLGKFSLYRTGVKKVDLSNTEIDEIKEKTFSCSKIEEIKLPECLSIIEEGAFKNSNLQKITMPNELEILGNNVFNGCFLNNVVNKCKIITCLDSAFAKLNLENIEINSLLIDDISDIKLQIVGKMKIEDSQMYKFTSLGKEIEFDIERYIFLMRDLEGSKYEFIVDRLEDFDFEDLILSFENHIKSINCHLYKVDAYNIERHLNIVSYEEALSTLTLPRYYGYQPINIRKDEFGKISGIKFNDKYRFIFDDFILCETGPEYTPSRQYSKYILSDIMPNIMDDEDIYKQFKMEDSKYKEFFNLTNRENYVKISER